MSRRGAVPVVMYHRVGAEIDDWTWSNSLTISPGNFQDHLEWLRRAGYYTASLEELHAHMSGSTPLPERSVVLTFDDGYIDNWTYVAPLLARYGFKALIAVVPDFVDPRDIVRPTIEDVWSRKLTESELEVRAFMSWPELRAARERGVLSIASHSLTHTWFAAGPRIVDFHHPGDGYYWLDWNHAPERKPAYLHKPEQSDVAWGTPVYENGRALHITRYFPDPAESGDACEFVAANGGVRFFEDPGWRQALHECVARRRETQSTEGRYESDSERAQRYEAELLGSRQLIEDKIAGPVPHFIWPGQVFNDESMDIARRVYASVDTSRGGAVLGIFNQPGGDAAAYRRFGVPDIGHGGQLYYPGGRYLVGCLDEFRGRPLARQRRQAMKLLLMAGVRAGWTR